MNNRSGMWNASLKLDSRERVRRALRHQPVDRPPLGEICIDPELVGAFLDRPKVGFTELLEFISILQLDLVCLPPPVPTAEALTTDPRNLSSTQWADMQKWRTESRAFVCAMLNGGFSRGIAAMGFQEFMVTCCREEERVDSILRGATELNIRLAHHAVEWGAQAIVLADDIAYQRETLVPVSFLAKHYFPSACTLVEEMNEQGVPVFFHSDGNLGNVLDLIVKTGFTGLHGIEKAAGMDLASLKQNYGPHLCLWGNMDPAHLMNSMDRTEIDREVRRIMLDGAPGGGFIFGTSSGLFSLMRSENLRWAYQTATGFRTEQ